MSDIFKFPNGGYEVSICRKQDILDAIDSNIIDKEIALSIVEQCELDCEAFVRKGRWAGIPYIGNIRVPKGTQLMNDPEQQALIDEAKALLEKDKYILFRKQLFADNKKRIKQNRYFSYITSISANKNKKLYRKLSRTKGEAYAKIYMFSIANLISVNNEIEILIDDEGNFIN